MFYSHDLLGRKTPLGAIWTLAHGRKLPKGKIISINLREICQEILQPGVPHSLRLQGILIGGVVIVYNKQQTYLLEDLQDMLRRVQAAGKSAVPEAGTGATTAGRNTLKRDKNQAKLEAITLMDMEDLLAPTGDMAFIEDDFLGLMAGGYTGLTGSTDLSGSRSKRRKTGDNQQEEDIADGLFIMPSMPSTSEGGLQDADRSRSRSRSVSWAAGPQNKDEEQQQDDVYGGLGQAGGFDQWNPADEMFDINTDLDLLAGLDLPLPDEPAVSNVTRPADSAITRTTATMSQAQQENPYDPTLLPDTEQHHDFLDMQQPQLSEQGKDILSPVSERRSELMEEQDTAEQDKQVDTPGGDSHAAAPTDSAQEQPEAVEADAKVTITRRSRKRKLNQALVDDLDNLQIKSKDYRDWVTDYSSLISTERKKGIVVAPAGAQMNNIVVNNILSANPQALLNPAAMTSHPAALMGCLPVGPAAVGGGGLGSVPLCAELLNLFNAALQAAGNAAGGHKHLPAPSSPEVNNSTGDGMLPGNLHREVHRDPLNLNRVPGEEYDPDSEEVEGRHHNMTLPENFEMQEDDELNQGGIDLPPGMDLTDGADLLMNDEAHDQLMELPYEVDIERMRAGPGSTHSGSLHLSSPRGSDKHAAGVRRADSDTSGSSMMLQGRAQDGPEVDSEGVVRGTKRTLRLSMQDSEGMDGNVGAGAIYYGNGALEDLLPDVDLPEAEDHEQAQDEGALRESEGHRSLSRTLSSVPTSQFPLVEETEPLEPTQLPTNSIVTHATKTVLKIFKQRLQPVDEAGVAENAVDPQLSLFGLMKEGHLSRSQAAKLFYQVCVTTTAGYITVQQDRAFGDITIRAGRNLEA